MSTFSRFLNTCVVFVYVFSYNSALKFRFVPIGAKIGLRVKKIIKIKNAPSVDVKMESYVNKYGSTERNRCFAHRDGCSIKWNNTLNALEILLKLDKIVKGNNIAEVWVGRDMSSHRMMYNNNCDNVYRLWPQ